MSPETAARTLDCHAHYVSPHALRAAREHPERYGVRIEATAEGERALLPGEPAGRRFPSTILSLAERGEHLPDLTVQLTSCWMDVTGYRLSADEGERWSGLLNDGLAEDIGSAPAALRFLGMATLPMQAPEAAARELERCVRSHGFRGAMICTNVAGENLDLPRFDPFWRQAQELGVPIILHPFGVAIAERVPRYYLENAVGNPTDTTIAATSLIFGGVLDRFPDLQVVLVHGGGFLPYQWGRFDQARRVRPETAVHEAALPHDYLRRFFYDTILFSPGALRYLIDVVGADRVVIGTDYPFDMGDFEPVKSLEAAGLDARAVRQVREASALRV